MRFNPRRFELGLATTFVVAGLLSAGPGRANEISPARVVGLDASGDAAIGLYSERTVVAGIEVDRDGARLLGYTIKPRPFTRPIGPRPVVPYEDRHELQLEIVLRGPDDRRYTQRVAAGMICLTHGANDESHVAGDTIRMHRDSFLVELPELPGFDAIEVAVHRDERGAVRRTRLGIETLTAERFTPAATSSEYVSLAFARHDQPPAGGATMASTVQWPEQFADPDIYRVYGDASESSKRINIVIVPDGYTYADKALMESHADATVAYFRGKSPHREHDPFINYILVYAYSIDSGTDQCDCDIIVVDTAMGTRFPESNPNCGNTDNRCLSYGGSCDTSGTSNIVAAELRAPAQDETLVMVNTTRYGGCGGTRATFAAGNSSARELAIHELGHSMGGLADEYFYNSGCGGFAGGINTSTEALAGSWSEWIADLGPPKEGGQYYDSCIYRPENDCEMRTLNRPFCAVCKQHYSLFTYGHQRVSASAPIEAITPPGNFVAAVDVPVDFSVDTRLSASPATHEISWTLDGPGLGGPTLVAGGSDVHTQSFDTSGQFTMTVQVTADTNLVKPARYGANQDSRSWTIDVLAPPPEVSGPGAAEPLRFADPQTLDWEDTSGDGMIRYNLYRGDLPLSAASSGDCYQQALGTPGATVSELPAPNSGWFFIVAARNAVGEGSLGQSSDGAERTSATPCE